MPTLYHDDAVLEFPQSGERFEGVANFREWRSQYPAAVEFRVRRISGSEDVWVGELSLRYDGGPWMLGVAALEFRGDRIALERIYVTEPWPAPEWRRSGAAPRPPSDHPIRRRAHQDADPLVMPEKTTVCLSGSKPTLR